jgi:hypothetical protein
MTLDPGLAPPGLPPPGGLRAHPYVRARCNGPRDKPSRDNGLPGHFREPRPNRWPGMGRAEGLLRENVNLKGFTSFANVPGLLRALGVRECTLCAYQRTGAPGVAWPRHDPYARPGLRTGRGYGTTQASALSSKDYDPRHCLMRAHLWSWRLPSC